MEDLIAFLRFHLADDEQLAIDSRSNGTDVWHPTDITHWSEVISSNAMLFCEQEHIARHDPKRVLADVAAKRQIIDHCEKTVAMLDPTDPSEQSWIVELAAVLKMLALPYSGHPEYREEWRS